MKYHFGEKFWQGDFVSGPLKGNRYTSAVANMTAEKWATVRSAVAVDFDKATLPDLKEGTRVFLINYCSTLLGSVD